MGSDIKSVLDSSHFVAVLHYNDLKTHDWNELRLKLDKHDISIKVVPTKITRKVLNETKFTHLSSLLHGTTSLAFSDKPCINDLLKVLKNESKLYLLGGVVEDELMTPKSIEDYAKLPGDDFLYSQLLGTLTAQQTNLTRLLLDGGAKGLHSRLSQLANKEE